MNQVGFIQDGHFPEKYENAKIADSDVRKNVEMSPICQSKQEYAHTDIVDAQKTPTRDGKEDGRDQRDDVDHSSL